MRLEFNPFNSKPGGTERYLSPWPGYVATRGRWWSWPGLKTDLRNGSFAFEFVALRLVCPACGKPAALLGRSLHPDADSAAIMWALMGGAIPAFNDDKNAPLGPDEWNVYTMFVACGTKVKGVPCRGELRRNLESAAAAIDNLHTLGRPIIMDLRE